MGVSMLEPDDKKRPDSSGHFGLCVSDQRKVRLGLIYGGSRPQALDDEYYSLFKASSIRLLEIPQTAKLKKLSLVRPREYLRSD